LGNYDLENSIISIRPSEIASFASGSADRRNTFMECKRPGLM